MSPNYTISVLVGSLRRDSYALKIAKQAMTFFRRIGKCALWTSANFRSTTSNTTIQTSQMSMSHVNTSNSATPLSNRTAFFSSLQRITAPSRLA